MDRDTWPQRKRMCLDGADYSDPNYVYFAALCARGLGAPFAHPALAQQVVTAIEWARAHERWLVFAYCLMPDHLHWLLQLTGAALPDLLRRFKSLSGGAINRSRGTPGRAVWQGGFHDQGMRDGADLQHVARYVVANPVRAGLVDSVRQYPHWDAVWL